MQATSGVLLTKRIELEAALLSGALRRPARGSLARECAEVIEIKIKPPHYSFK